MKLRLLFFAFVLLPGVCAVFAPSFVRVETPRPPADDPPVVAPAITVAHRPGQPAVVRVAAVQCYSRMGRITANRKLLTDLVTRAAGLGAKIVVLPECAAHGYMQPADGTVWSVKAREESGELPVQSVAESLTGSTRQHFAALARELEIYLTVPFIEIDQRTKTYFNTVLLVDPAGHVVAHHRKASLWTPGDGLWATEAPALCKPVDSPYGRLGLMICHDVHIMPPVLKQAGVDIVLYSVGWYGPNTESWYREMFPQRYVVPNNFAVIAANWSADPSGESWHGTGYSCIIRSDGVVLAMAQSPDDAEIVIADIPVAPARKLREKIESPAEE
jgi:predicted amidohydrolase